MSTTISKRIEEAKKRSSDNSADFDEVMAEVWEIIDTQQRTITELRHVLKNISEGATPWLECDGDGFDRLKQYAAGTLKAVGFTYGPDNAVLKALCTSFYYWWHNQPGTNTLQGFDEWMETDRAKELVIILRGAPGAL